MPSRAIVIVTGANRGVGRAIAQSIAISPVSENQSMVLYATSRQGSDIGLSVSANTQVVYAKLDINDPSSVRRFADQVKREEDKGGKLTVLINNAGVRFPYYTTEDMRKTMDTNYRGTLNVCQTLIPFLSDGGRIVNLSSVASTMGIYRKDIDARFKDPNMTLRDLEELANDYQTAFENKTEENSGFGISPSPYRISKRCINALTAVLARQHQGLIINACCPGWIDTDMGQQLGGTPAKTCEEGAKIPIKLAFGDINGRTGHFWANDSTSSTDDGKVQEW